MRSFQERLAIGSEHEHHVAEELALRGWASSECGQGCWAEAVRHALRNTDSGIRWTPDLITARDDAVVLVDAKTTTSPQTGRHTVSRDAVRAQRQLATIWDIPIYYVFSDLGVMTPEEVIQTGGQHIAVGRRGPFYFIPAELCTPFDEVFGAIRDPFPAWSSQLRAA